MYTTLCPDTTNQPIHGGLYIIPVLCMHDFPGLSEELAWKSKAQKVQQFLVLWHCGMMTTRAQK